MSNAAYQHAHRSLLNRLNAQPNTSQAHQSHSHQRELQKRIQRDLEFLLNTKCSLPHQIDDLDWVKKSSIQFGMHDFMNINYSSEQGKQQLCFYIRQCIETFEPRLGQCEIEIEDNSHFRAMLSIHITANVAINNQSCQIAFETLLQPEQALFKITKGAVL